MPHILYRFNTLNKLHSPGFAKHSISTKPSSIRASLLSAVTYGSLMLFSAPLHAAQTSANASRIDIWDALMLAIVLLTTASSAALSVAACRQWTKGWRLVAAAPLLALLVWVLWIGVARYLDPLAHSLWSFELFGWALLNLLYMATVLTAKRTFEKTDSH